MWYNQGCSFSSDKRLVELAITFCGISKAAVLVLTRDYSGVSYIALWYNQGRSYSSDKGLVELAIMLCGITKAAVLVLKRD